MRSPRVFLPALLAASTALLSSGAAFAQGSADAAAPPPGVTSATPATPATVTTRLLTPDAAPAPSPGPDTGAAAPLPAAPADAPVDLAAYGRGNARDDVIRDARDAWGKKDRARLAADRAQAMAQRHPLAEWVDYWELAARLGDASAPEIDAFFARWPGTYLEDRLRNDWLLEAGRRRDWVAFSRDWPRFRMNDDRAVACYALLVDHFAGKDVRDAARAAWLAQKDADEGCQLLAQTLYDDKVFTDDDVMLRLRQSAEFGRARASRAAAQIFAKPPVKELAEIWDNPARFLVRRGDTATARRNDLATLALVRMGANDPSAAASQMSERWEGRLGSEDAAWVWAVIAKQGGQALLPDAVDWQERAWAAAQKPSKSPLAERTAWGDDVHAWHARAALRAGTGQARWRDLERSIDAMSVGERADPAWVYWRARAETALAKDNAEGDARRAEARAALGTISSDLGFYGLLAAEDLGAPFVLPARPAALTPAERAAARANGGLQRAQALLALGLRDEGRREWNYSLRGMGDRELLAAAQSACDVSDWQICINTSDRTRGDIDLAQRYPMPYQRDITSAATAAGLEPAFVFGLIRQETRFMSQLRSGVGASGLMQLMPATAKWAARKAGIDYRPELITDNATNLRIGTYYLKTVLDTFGNSAPMAAAAYNAGPGRPRRWRGTLMVEPAIWAENVPFLETRDYVKKVMTNAAIYAALQGGKAPQLRARLGGQIGPRDAEQPPSPDMP